MPGWLESTLYGMGFRSTRIGIQLWISDADGKNLVKFGSAKAASRGSEWIGGATWSPDGKKLAFSYNHLLYVLPVK